ncbi:hypothetical protein AYL99_05474 [Fonsecaea erecta]|uniref:Zn(2)-C6 fungal-type domain-containing protein n=1 Tax=Fonsecaea erecta TaxID=1367422 RepID=A0A178ZLE2_9EURO|nr:hypothetical protein AYL99_05474 [Fonsecaea erecta]OAP60472.1 hypothetical protein AYL99_05474 [Fonsecaea erecta]
MVMKLSGIPKGRHCVSGAHVPHVRFLLWQLAVEVPIIVGLAEQPLEGEAYGDGSPGAQDAQQDDNLVGDTHGRIKCDESQPYCRRCTETGRKCEGPIARHIRFAEDESSAPKPLVLLAELSLRAPKHSDDERWAFNYFIYRVAPVFAGIIDGPFWLELIPRLAHSYTFVWHMVMSISWAFEHVQYGELKPVFDTGRPIAVVSNAEHRRALKWYSKALVSFRQQLEQGEADNAHALLSCILFSAFEFQQRNVGNAMHLMDNAYKMLGQNLAGSSALLSRTANTDLDETVTAFSSRKAILMATLATPEWKCRAREGISRPFVVATLSVLDEFRQHLYKLMYKAYEVVRVADLLSHDEYEMRKLRPRQQKCLGKLQRWKDTLIPVSNGLQDGEARWLSSYLLMYWGVCHIWLSSCLSPWEVSFDEHMHEFANIVERAEEIIDHNTRDEISSPIFAEEIEMIMALYFAATKCRNAIVRRRALRLIRKIPRRREGFWASIASPRVVEKMIAIEEGQEHFLEYPLPAGLLSFPPEDQRIHRVSIVKGDVHKARRRLKLQWTKVAFDEDGSFRMVHENVWLEECIEEPGRNSAIPNTG